MQGRDTGLLNGQAPIGILNNTIPVSKSKLNLCESTHRDWIRERERERVCVCVCEREREKKKKTKRL